MVQAKKWPKDCAFGRDAGFNQLDENQDVPKKTCSPSGSLPVKIRLNPSCSWQNQPTINNIRLVLQKETSQAPSESMGFQTKCPVTNQRTASPWHYFIQDSFRAVGRDLPATGSGGFLARTGIASAIRPTRSQKRLICISPMDLDADQAGDVVHLRASDAGHFGRDTGDIFLDAAAGGITTPTLASRAIGGAARGERNTDRGP